MKRTLFCHKNANKEVIDLEPIFKRCVSPVDISWLQATADHEISQLEGDTLNLYAISITQALVAVLNSCVKYKINVVLWYYNNCTGEFYKQGVLKSHEEEQEEFSIEITN